MSYRNLTENEIEILNNNNCTADDWSNISVKKNFKPYQIKNVKFAGKNKLGIFSETIEVVESIQKKCGIENAYIKDCSIGDNVYISNTGNISCYNIESEVVIDNVNTLIVTEETSFGNGTEIKVLNADGGRETIIYDRMSSQIAYLQTAYRHDHQFISDLQFLICQYVNSKKSDRGSICRGAKVINSSSIINVNIGEYCTISGIQNLKEGTIVSSKTDPVFIGNGVIAENFIVLSGSKISGGSIIDNSFIGQAVCIDKQFSAENSCFFANSEGFHGEACSLFAGPYTVTHHKSTLLIAAMFSFFNAGSGSNQSNHMYKLGPKHQGIVERGSKTGSFSYMLWPCRIGCYSVVIGKHFTNFNSTDFPFSYILESKGRSILIPAMNLATAGTKRDFAKWPARDRRKTNAKLDLINFNLFTPYTIGKILKGMKILKDLMKKTEGRSKDMIKYNGLFIDKRKLNKAYNKYNLAINIFIGNEFVKQLDKSSELNSTSEILNKLNTKNLDNSDKWIDLSGLIASKEIIKKLMESVKKKKINSIDQFSENLKRIDEKYHDLAWIWCLSLIEEKFKKKITQFTKENLIDILHSWAQSIEKFNKMVLYDITKEFSLKNRIGYGIDGDEYCMNREFDTVFGKYEENKFVKNINTETKEILEKSNNYINFVEKL